MTKQYAVIDRDGFGQGNTTCVYSAHSSEEAAKKAASRHRVTLPGGKPNQSTAMVIRGGGGFAKGETIYRDNVRSLYSVVW